MDNNNIVDNILKIISNLGWIIYTKVAWRKNPHIQSLLQDESIRDNLGFYLREGHEKFK